MLVWLMLVIALARPQWLEPPVERTIPTRDLLLLVDLSGSMDQRDFVNSEGLQVNRLEALKEILQQFLANREGDRVGLVVFGNAPFLQVPLTTDLQVCQELLAEAQVGMAGPRTALGDAIGLGIKLLENSDTPQKTLIAVTDGNDTASAVPPEEAARIARDQEITIHTIAIGDPENVGEEKLDEQVLKNVAASTDGKYFLAMDQQELALIYDELDQIETRQVNKVSHRPRRDMYYWPLGLAILLSMIVSGLGTYAEPTVSQQPLPVKLRVNSRTYELETVEQ